jgi:hypothetical protein
VKWIEVNVADEQRFGLPALRMGCATEHQQADTESNTQFWSPKTHALILRKQYVDKK